VSRAICHASAYIITGDSFLNDSDSVSKAHIQSSHSKSILKKWKQKWQKKLIFSRKLEVWKLQVLQRERPSDWKKTTDSVRQNSPSWSAYLVVRGTLDTLSAI